MRNIHGPHRRKFRLACSISLKAAAATLAIATVANTPVTVSAQAQSAVPTPESWFGHQMGADRQLEPYDKMVGYYRALAAGSDRIKLVELGQSTEGRPFLALFISSPENLARLEEYRQMNLKLADPRGTSQEELDRIVKEGKAVVLQSYDLHSSEIGSSLTSVEFTHGLVTKNDDRTLNILDNVISIVMPSLNPDGHDMIHDWYMKYVGTPYEGGSMPWLYQKYVGHDNNRDAFMQNMVESQMLGSILFRDWIPEAYIDHHQMGQYSPRISIPPYTDPIRPDGDPLVWREMTWYGANMAYDLDEADLAGGIGDAIYSGWGHFGFHWLTPFHNITGMLDESASAALASPLYVHPEQLKGGQRAVPDNEPQMNMPNPWPGGWWRPRDIVDRQLVTSWSLADTAAINRERILRNMYLKAQRQTERGAEADVKAYIVAAGQHDPLTTDKMINALLLQGVNVYTAPAEFVHEGAVYPAGSFVVPMNQPKMGVVRWLLGETHFPDDDFARTRDGKPIRPYDMSTDTLTEFMGVKSTPASTMVTANLQPLGAMLDAQGTVEGSGSWLLSGALNDSFHAVNKIIKAGGKVSRVTAPSGTAATGDFIVTGISAANAQSIAAETGVDFASAPGGTTASAPVKMPRIAMLQRYRGGNIDEGWTRFLFESYEYPYKSIMDAEIKGGRLADKYDVIVLPDDGLSSMTGIRKPDEKPSPWDSLEGVPPEYHSGFGEEGAKALDAFVKAGGRIITFGRAGSLPLEYFDLPVVNVLDGLSTTEFWSPGSTLKIDVDTDDAMAMGMPDDALAVFTAGNQAYDMTPSIHNDVVNVVARYADGDVLKSGWLLGEDKIKGKPAIVEVKHGEGEVVMIGFRPQHRDQTHGTYKFVFDALMAP